MKVLLYDDHPFVTEAITSYINVLGEMQVVGMCHTIEDFKVKLANTKPDIVISDVLSDEDAGFTVFHYILEHFPKIKIVAYTSISSSFIIHSLLDLGVHEVVNKRENIATLIDKVKQVYESSTSKNYKVVDLLTLTPREKQIVDFLKLGLVAKEIAVELGTSPHTINNQKNALLEKFGCTNSIELIVKLSQMGLVGLV